MKLLTINTHSLKESSYKEKLGIFLDAIEKYEPDIIAMQEVMQPKEGKRAQKHPKAISLGKVFIKEGNHALNVLNMLCSRGLDYNLVWIGIKQSYDSFDEGLCIFTKYDIDEIKSILLSPFDDYYNWKTRKALGIRIGKRWFYSVHLGWWDDAESPLKNEIEELKSKISNERVWLLGDFNCPDTEKDKGYSLLSKYWCDTYKIARKRDDGITVEGEIDGWKSQDSKRIDYIFTNEDVKIKSSYVIFNGINEGIISDHFGVMIETEEDNERSRNTSTN